MTYSQAVSKAKQLAKKNQKHYFVVRECDEIAVCDSFDLDTFYLGIGEQNILFCTEEMEFSAW